MPALIADFCSAHLGLFEWGRWVLPIFTGTLYLLDDGESRKGMGTLSVVSLLESIPDIAIIVSPKKEIVEANSAALQVVGQTREELRGAAAEQLSQIWQVTDGARVISGNEGIVVRALSGEMVRNERR